MSYAAWICCQIGAREHYAIPRALHQAGQPVYLITDAWVKPNSIINRIPHRSLKNLQERYHADLAQVPAHSFTHSLLQFELIQKAQRRSGWDCVIARNRWFQQRAVNYLRSLTPQIEKQDIQPILFAYSYAALEIFRYAKAQGWRTILGQIDPGPVEEEIVKAEHIRHPEFQSSWQPAPPEYWSSWREECALADRIIVNSPWSSQALLQVGIPIEKINIVPLAYQPPVESRGFTRTYPEAFTAERPLRVLFLGQVILRKGIVALLEAAELLRDQPVEFWIVGPSEITLPTANEAYGKMHWVDPVPRSVAAQYYQMADVFLFPTLSDGFGLTQLEAQAWKLPIISSQRCGEVVSDGNNGIRLPTITGPAIAHALTTCLERSIYLTQLSSQSNHLEAFSLLQLSQKLKTFQNLNCSPTTMTCL